MADPRTIYDGINQLIDFVKYRAPCMSFVHCIICQQFAVKMGNASSHRHHQMMRIALITRGFIRLRGWHGS
jgi:hypothetical protein